MTTDLIIKVEKIHADAVVPEFAHDTDSGFDLYTCEDVTIPAGETAIVPTGLKLELPYGWGVQIKNKSGITVKGVPVYSFVLDIEKLQSNRVLLDERAPITVFEGTVDMMYRGPIGIMVRNDRDIDMPITIPKHTKIAQGVLRRVYSCGFEVVDKISTDTSRGEKGYGSSGTTLTK